MDEQKKRLLMIGLLGLVSIGAVFLLTDPAMSPQQPAANPPATSSAPPAITATTPNGKAPRMPEGAQVAGLPARDIFAPPPEYGRFAPQDPKNDATGGGRTSLATGPIPVLTGIISGDSTRVAILRQGAISRSHRVGETAGAYRVAAIGPDSVTLTGHTGTVVLKIGQ